MHEANRLKQAIDKSFWYADRYAPHIHKLENKPGVNRKLHT